MLLFRASIRSVFGISLFSSYFLSLRSLSWLLQKRISNIFPFQMLQEHANEFILWNYWYFKNRAAIALYIVQGLYRYRYYPGEKKVFFLNESSSNAWNFALFKERYSIRKFWYRRNPWPGNSSTRTNPVVYDCIAYSIGPRNIKAWSLTFLFLSFYL